MRKVPVRFSPSVCVPEIYFDNNATTCPLPEVTEAVSRSMVEAYGNPSSVHQAGTRARGALRTAREQVAALLQARSDTVVFTSGTTEANNLVLQNLLIGGFEGFRLITTNVEHSSILETAACLRSKGVSVTILEVDSAGHLEPEAMLEAIEPGRTLVSIHWANNETGVIQPISRLSAIARDAGALFHTDAAQAVGKIPIDLSALPVDFLSVSGHKIHGPLGVGALVGPGIGRLHPLTFGGSQENSLRPGTENVPAIVGLGVALEVRGSRFELVAEATRRLRDRFETHLLQTGLAGGINGDLDHRLPNSSNIRFAQVDGDALTIRLDQKGIRCSQSSACTSQKPEPSYVLRAMGLSEADAFASVRFGFSEMNTPEEVDFALEAMTEIHASLSHFAVA